MIQNILLTVFQFGNVVPETVRGMNVFIIAAPQAYGSAVESNQPVRGTAVKTILARMRVARYGNVVRKSAPGTARKRIRVKNRERGSADVLIRPVRGIAI